MLGMLSAVLGVVSLCCGPCLGFGGSGALFLFDFIPAIAAIVLGVLHLQRINRGQASNRSLAVIGIALGAVGVIIAICLSASNTGVQWHEDIT